MTWSELVKRNEQILKEAAAEAIKSSLRTGDDFEVRIDPFGNIDIRPYINEMYILIPDDTIALYTAQSGYPDYVEDTGNGNDSVLPLLEALSEESAAVMAYLRKKYSDIDTPGTMYKNRFFEALSDMYPESYKNYRLAAIQPAVERILENTDIISIMLMAAEKADNETNA